MKRYKMFSRFDLSEEAIAKTWALGRKSAIKRFAKQKQLDPLTFIKLFNVSKL